MTEKRERWQGKDWNGRTKSRWQQPAGGEGGQSLHDAWDIAKQWGRRREISAEMDAVGTAVKEKTSTWHKSCKESTKRKTELFTIVEVAVTDEKHNEKERCMIRDLLVELRKRMEEEDEARNLIEEMQRNLDDARNKSYDAEQKLNHIQKKTHRSFDKEQGRPRLKLTKLWQLMQGEKRRI